MSQFKTVSTRLSELKPGERFLIRVVNDETGESTDWVYEMVQYVERKHEKFFILTNASRNGRGFESGLDPEMLVSKIIEE